MQCLLHAEEWTWGNLTLYGNKKDTLFSQQAPGDQLHLSQDLMDVKLSEEQLAMGKTSRIIADQDILGPKLRITPLEMISLSQGEKELQRHMVATHM